MATTRTALFLVAAGLIACDRVEVPLPVQLPAPVPEVPVVTKPVDHPEPPPTPVRVDPVAVPVGPAVETPLMPPDAVPEPHARSRRRLDLDQLDATIRRVTGGLGWTEMRGNTEVNLLQELSGTLGKPDFLTLTQEDLEPSAMFQKFLGDASRSVCTRLLAREATAAPRDRVFLVNVDPTDTWATSQARIQQNVRTLLLRFHGRALGTSAPELASWYWLYESAEHVTRSPTEAWRTICVGLLTHPDFYSY